MKKFFCTEIYPTSMESNLVSLVATAILVAAISLIICYKWKVKKSPNAIKFPLPPGPRGLPLLGNLPFIDPQLHTYFTKLNLLYGPVFRLKFGRKLCIVVGSTASAREVLKDHDAIFANRDITRALHALTYGGTGLAWAPYGSHWRTQRTAAREILSKTSLDAVSELQTREIRRTVGYIHSKVHTPVNIADQLFLASLNLILNMMLGGSLSDDELPKTGKELKRLLDEFVALLLMPNVSDFFPVLARFDIQGVERRAKKIFVCFDVLISSILDDRIKLNQANGGNKGSDLLDIILKLKEKADPNTGITITDIKAMFQVMFLGATESTASVVEWAMAEIMAQPKILKRIHDELKAVVGENNVVELSHIPKLHFLDAVLKETHRLHPSGPLLGARSPSETCIIGGYTVPKGTQVLVNVLALHTDEKVWEKPLEFKPERFLNEGVKWDYSGNNMNYIPFGSGRRICAGISLAERSVPYALASLVHSFEWRLSDGVENDFSATFGIILRKTTPLVAIPTPRLSSAGLYG